MHCKQWLIAACVVCNLYSSSVLKWLLHFRCSSSTSFSTSWLSWREWLVIPGSAANGCSCGLLDCWLLYRSAAVVSCYHIWRTTMPATNPILNPRDLPYCVNCYMFTIMFILIRLAMLVGQVDCWLYSFAFDWFFSVHNLSSHHIKIIAHQWIEWINSLQVVIGTAIPKLSCATVCYCSA